MSERISQFDSEPNFPNEQPTSRRAFLMRVFRPRQSMDALREKQGGVVTVSYRGLRFVTALTPEAAREILAADPDGYDAFWKESFTGLTGSGSLWVMSGNRHRQERQLLSPGFHGNGFGSMGMAIRDIARRRTGQWESGEEVVAVETTFLISRDVIMRVVFGIEDEALVRSGARVLSNLRKNLHPLVVFLPGLQRSWFPHWRKYRRAKMAFSAWLRSYLAHRRAQGRENNDVLGRMLSTPYQDGSLMSDEDIRDELITILLAGHETTATALAWALYELSRHPAELEQLRGELARLGPEPDPAFVAKLPRLSAVCNETLRLHTLLPEVARVLTAPTNMFGCMLPPGTSVVISIMAIHHDPHVYPQPDRFRPQRFLERSYSPYEFLPFGGGHRRCLGASLSDYEMRIVLAEIVTHWDFEALGAEQEIRHDIAMGSRHGIRLRVRARELEPST